MKASELMIGDWLKSGENRCPRRVISLESLYDWDEVILGNRFDNAHRLLPVPLTPEILKVNGFKQYEDYEDAFVLYADQKDEFGNPYTILISGDEYTCYDMKVFLDNDVSDVADWILPDFKNVHELQHALRLCRLNGLADNFKVE